MSDKLYNIIIHSKPEFWSGSDPYVDFPKERFLEHTEDHLRNQFQSLDENTINELKRLPTLFAVENEEVDTRIGTITNIEVNSKRLRIYYEFSEEHYPLTKGVLQQNWQKLNINDRFEFYRTHWAIKEADISVFYKEYLKTIKGITHQLKNIDKKVQLIYAFNGSGKTRLSREFKELIDSKTEAKDDVTKIFYYNAFTEDLFSWDNDLEGDRHRKLKIQPNNYTQWVLETQGQGNAVIDHFQHYTSDKLTPDFNQDFSEVTFSFKRGNDEQTKNVKISKGEESIFIWCIFFALLEEIIEMLNEKDASNRETDKYNQLEYVFIDDPVTSLDENHLIELAVNLALLIKSSKSNLRFIITTHSPLFYNVLYRELGLDRGYILSKLDDGGFMLEEKEGATNTAFAYHLHIKHLIEQALNSDNMHDMQRYHFTLLRNLYEKTAAFLGYSQWTDLLDTIEGNKKAYYKKIINISSHSQLSGEEISEPTDTEKQTVEPLLDNLTKHYVSWAKQQKKDNQK